MDLTSIVAGAGWGLSAGLAIALAVALWPRARASDSPREPRDTNAGRSSVPALRTATQ